MKCETTNIFRYKIMIYTAEFSHCEDCPLISVMSLLSKDRESVYVKIFNTYASPKRKRTDSTQNYTVSTAAAFLLDTFIHNVRVAITTMTISNDLKRFASDCNSGSQISALTTIQHLGGNGKFNSSHCAGVSACYLEIWTSQQLLSRLNHGTISRMQEEEM